MLDKLETDFFGDLSNDTHGVWEIFAFVRHHNPESSDAVVLDIGKSYLMRWIEKHWITLAPKSLYPTQVRDLEAVFSFVQERDIAATVYIEGAPSLDISEAGTTALSAEPNKTVQRTRFARR